jgi:D-glycero-D-manno-heptose 1,7-bisphosphate phosphatase
LGSHSERDLQCTDEKHFLVIHETRQRRFIVLDRDGTIIEEREYLSQPEQVRLIPGAGAALRELRQMGFGLVVITNQSGMGRGLFDQVQLERVHERLRKLLENERVHLDGIYVCPHRPEDDCDCRKPKLRLLKKAAKDLNFSLESSIVIGDKASDMEMGRIAGATTFLVRTGYGSQTAAAVGIPAADYVVDNLPASVEIIRGLLTKTEWIL